MRLHSVSLYNTDADVLWLSEGALGPDEHNVVVEAIEGQKEDKSQSYYEYGMEDGRIAIFLPIRLPRGDLAGTVMILADMKSISEGTMERIVTPQVRSILVKIAMFMGKNVPAGAPGDGPPEIAMPASATPAPVNVSSAAVVEKLPQSAKTPLGPREVEQILELELVAEPPRAAPAPPVAPVATAAPAGKAGGNRKGGAAASSPASAPPVAPVATLSSAASAGAASSKAASRGGAKPAAVSNGAPSSARGAPTLAPVPSKGPPPAIEAPPARGDIDVLPFDPGISIPVAKAASAPPADIEVLAFEPDIEVAPAKRAASPAAGISAKPAASSAADIEVLSFDAEPPVVGAAPVVTAAPPVAPPVVSAAPPVAPRVVSAPPLNVPTVSAAPAAPPVAKSAPPSLSAGSTSSVRAFKVTAASYPASTSTTTSVPALKPGAAAPANAPAASASPGKATPARSAQPASSAAAPAPSAAAPGKAAPAKAAKPAPAPAPASTAQTAALPVVSDTDEVGLIQDTGPVPVLSATSIEPAPDLPPLEPLSVEESATDLTLFAQELIKLRSNGRTRRYEVLARSQRDLHRNEVPAAFVAESARGKDGAALDSMVLERLLVWLGKHGETIWDSEPASFSVNLSIGAIEDETFLQRVEQWLEKNSVPAEYVGFEIGEFACVNHKPAVKKLIDTVERMGCFLVIDNFSLDSGVFEFLGSKALRHVKLDPKLTAAAMKEKLPQALVVAILQACKVLGVHCVAKRVDSQSSMQWLTAVGCDFAQSFSLHKPLPLESLASGAPIKALRE